MLQIVCGVPQGSILGPLFFVVYMNDLPNCLKHAHPSLFADDTALFAFSKNYTTLIENMNSELKSLSRWFTSNQLSLNVKKSGYMLFSKKVVKEECIDLDADSEAEIQLHGMPLPNLTQVKFLGLTWTPTLTWQTHIHNVACKISRYIPIFSRLRHYLPLSTMLLLYSALIYPHLIYSIEIWGSNGASMRPLLQFQKKIVRILTFSHFRAPSAPLFQHLRILTIAQIYQLRLAALTHKIIYRKIKQPLLLTLTRQSTVHGYNTRGACVNLFTIPSSESEYGYRSLQMSCTKLWNTLPAELTDIVAPIPFRKALKSKLLGPLPER
eukprot:Pompholyxophrys_punicea_v1_NODE_127_length_3306_cov_27.855737.p2 type:complete len:324 gc:universal NODE_127_length_3306_cov_27.855737:1274-303(-)